MARVREKYESQIADLESGERTTLAKYTECRQSLAKALEEVALLKGTLEQKDIALEQAHTRIAKMTQYVQTSTLAMMR